MGRVDSLELHRCNIEFERSHTGLGAVRHNHTFRQRELDLVVDGLPECANATSKHAILADLALDLMLHLLDLGSVDGLLGSHEDCPPIRIRTGPNVGAVRELRLNLPYGIWIDKARQRSDEPLPIVFVHLICIARVRQKLQSVIEFVYQHGRARTGPISQVFRFER